MSSIKKSVMFSTQTVNYIRNRCCAENEIAWSQALNEGFKTLSWLTRQALPDLTAAEWEVILKVYTGSIVKLHPPFRIASDIMDNFGALELSQLDPQVAAVATKIHGMNQMEQFAILDFVQIFWANDWIHEPDFDSIACKIKEMM